MADFKIHTQNIAGGYEGWVWKRATNTVTKTQLPNMATHTGDVTLEKGTYIVYAELLYDLGATSSTLTADMMNGTLVFLSDTTAKAKVTMPAVESKATAGNYHARASTSSVLDITEDVPKLGFRMGKTDMTTISGYSAAANTKHLEVVLIKI